MTQPEAESAPERPGGPRGDSLPRLGAGGPGVAPHPVLCRDTGWAGGAERGEAARSGVKLRGAG